MIIKIIRNTVTPFGELVWYANRIGEIFEVHSEGDNFVNVWINGEIIYPIGHVKDSDCVVVEESKTFKYDIRN